MYLVQDILDEYVDDIFIAFIDNILIFSCTTEEHAKHIRLIFQRLKEYQI